MDVTAAQGVVTSTLSTFGGAVLVIITAVIAVGVAYLVYRFGWRKVKGSLR